MHVSVEEKSVKLSASWEPSGIMAHEVYERAEALLAEPNINPLYPRTIIPTLHAWIPKEDSLLICAILAQYREPTGM